MKSESAFTSSRDERKRVHVTDNKQRGGERSSALQIFSARLKAQNT